MYFWRLSRNIIIIIFCACFAKADAISDLYDALQMDRVNEIIRVEGIRDAQGTGAVSYTHLTLPTNREV